MENNTLLHYYTKSSKLNKTLRYGKGRKKSGHPLINHDIKNTMLT